MKDRILEFLQKENKTSAQFAEEIGVQPSGISHILSGRNKPSLDFVIKMLDKYKYISAEWLLFGTGSMYREKELSSLFDNDDDKSGYESEGKDKLERKPLKDMQASLSEGTDREKGLKENRNAEKIVWFYSDGTFDSYVLRKD